MSYVFMTMLRFRAAILVRTGMVLLTLGPLITGLYYIYAWKRCVGRNIELLGFKHETFQGKAHMPRGILCPYMYTYNHCNIMICIYISNIFREMKSAIGLQAIFAGTWSFVCKKAKGDQSSYVSSLSKEVAVQSWKLDHHVRNVVKFRQTSLKRSRTSVMYLPLVAYESQRAQLYIVLWRFA